MKTQISTLGIVLLTAITFNLFAVHVGIDEARTIGKNFYWENSRNLKAMSYQQIVPELFTTETLDGTSLYYVFNINCNDGFVIVAADDQVVPVLGYSFSGSFSGENIPPAMATWLQNYTDQISEIINMKFEGGRETEALWEKYAAYDPSPPKSSTVGPLLKSAWNQNAFYNEACPADATGPGGHVYAGCVATAMGQIIKFWEFPVQGTGSHSYNHPVYGVQTANFGTANYDYSLMPDSIKASNVQIATLLYHCGVSVDMDYGPNGSGAYSHKVRGAFIDYFKYSPDAVYLLKSNFTTAKWQNMLITELNEGNPLYYKGDEGDGGHAFVCDGYQGSDYFHFNWGWSGRYDNYFYLNNLNPGLHNFTSDQAAIFHLYPLSHIYVKWDATGANNGKSWANAYTNLHVAIENAKPGEIIWVAKGTYEPTGNGTLRYRHFALKNKVGIYGGFDGTENPATFNLYNRKFIINETILDGQSDRFHVVYNSGVDSTALLDGFTISGGYAYGDGNFIPPPPETERGAGMYNDQSSPRIVNCRFYDNHAITSGGGMYNKSSHPTIINSVFSSNTAYECGGGMFNNMSNPKIYNDLFSGNFAGMGAALGNTFSNPVIINTTISGNLALVSGGGIFNDDGGVSTVNIKNSIIWLNRVMYDDGTGIYYGHQICNWATNTVNLENTCINTGGNLHNYGTGFINFGAGCIFVDPKFVFLESAFNAPTRAGNYRLTEISPARDAGNDLFVPALVTKDLDWNPRIVYLRVDMGAYEIPADCLPPKNLTTINITDVSADLIWTPGGTELQWNVEWGITGFPQGVGNAINNIATSQLSLVGLTPATVYDFYVQAVCGPGNVSAWVGPISFATAVSTQLPVVQQLNIPQGWSGISSYVIPDNRAVVSMFAPCINDLVVIQSGFNLYWPAQNVNSIGNWDVEKGYTIKMSNDVTLQVNGQKTSSTDVILNTGWNLFPVLSSVPVSAASLLSSLPCLVVAKGIPGGIYWPGYNINTIGALEPGSAYWVYTTCGCTLTFPSVPLKGSPHVMSTTEKEIPSPWNKVIKNQSSHLVVVMAEDLINSVQNIIIGAFNSNGTCVGIAEINSENTVISIFADDPTTAETDGMKEGEKIIFRVFDPDKGTDIPINPIFDPSFTDSDGNFRVNGLSKVDVKTSLPEIYTTTQVILYPNPANDFVNIEVAGDTFDDASIVLYDLTGQVVLQTIFKNTPVKRLETRGLSPGIYQLVIQTNESRFSRKLVIK